MLPAFPKINAMGTKYVASIFDEPVEITEKIDGSQFVFGVRDGELKFRSKGAEIFYPCTNKMFSAAVDVVGGMAFLPEGLVFYCEYLSRPKHNVLAYDRVPTNHLMLFGVSYGDGAMRDDHDRLCEFAILMGIECVPLLYQGMTTAAEVLDMIGRKSVLGGVNIEGVVIKNYKDTFIADRVFPIMAAKYVSEKFKEVHSKNWSKNHTAKGRWETAKDGYCTEARWQKAVQHLRDAGKLEVDPRDIGALIKAVRQDIVDEEMDAIKAILWRQFGQDLLGRSVAGLPQWYKEQLALGNIDMKG